MDLAFQNLQQVAEDLSDVGLIERPPKSEGRRLTMVMVPGKDTGEKSKSTQPTSPRRRVAAPVGRDGAQPAVQTRPAQEQAADRAQPAERQPPDQTPAEDSPEST